MIYIPQFHFDGRTKPPAWGPPQNVLRHWYTEHPGINCLIAPGWAPQPESYIYQTDPDFVNHLYYSPKVEVLGGQIPNISDNVINTTSKGLSVRPANELIAKGVRLASDIAAGDIIAFASVYLSSTSYWYAYVKYYSTTQVQLHLHYYNSSAKDDYYYVDVGAQPWDIYLYEWSSFYNYLIIFSDEGKTRDSTGGYRASASGNTVIEVSNSYLDAAFFILTTTNGALAEEVSTIYKGISPPVIATQFTVPPSPSVTLAAAPLNFANSITGRLSQGISIAATPLEAVSNHSGGAFIQPGPVSGVLDGTLDIVGSVYIGEGYIHSAAALNTTCTMSFDGLIWGFTWDAEDALSADVGLLGNSLQGVIIEAAPLGASLDLESVSGISFILSSIVEELNLTLTGDQAAYVEKEEVLESTTGLEGRAVISHNLAVLPLEFENVIQGDMIPVGSVNWSSSTLEESGAISADLVQSVNRDVGDQLVLTEDIFGSPATQYSVIFDASTLTGYLTLTWNFERFQFILKGNYHKTDAVSKLETDVVLKGGQNAA